MAYILMQSAPPSLQSLKTDPLPRFLEDGERNSLRRGWLSAPRAFGSSLVRRSREAQLHSAVLNRKCRRSIRRAGNLARIYPAAISCAVLLTAGVVLAVSSWSSETRSTAADEIAARFATSRFVTPDKPQDLETQFLPPRYVPLTLLAKFDLATYDYYKTIRFAPAELINTVVPPTVPAKEPGVQPTVKDAPAVAALTVPEPKLVSHKVPVSLIVRNLPELVSITGGERKSTGEWVLRLKGRERFDITLPAKGAQVVTANVEAVREDGKSAGTFVVTISRDGDGDTAAKSEKQRNSKAQRTNGNRPPKRKTSSETSQVPAQGSISALFPEFIGTGAGDEAGAKVKGWQSGVPRAVQKPVAATAGQTAQPVQTAVQTNENKGALANATLPAPRPYEPPLPELQENIRAVMNGRPGG